MTSMMTAFVALFVVFSIGPMLGRAAVRLLNRVPILGAVATLGLFFVLSDPSLAAADAGFDLAPSPLEFSVSEAPAWSPEHPDQKWTADEDLHEVYHQERMRYAAEIEALRDAVQAWIAS